MTIQLGGAAIRDEKIAATVPDLCGYLAVGHDGRVAL
jgi:hypothetical protein